MSGTARGEVGSGGSSSRSIPDHLFQLFTATLSPDKTTRQSAEAALSELAEQDPHFILHLLELASRSPTVCANAFHTGLPSAASALLASAIRFRNEVGRSDWNRNPHCTAEVQRRVREHVVSLQCQPHVSEAVRRQLLAATIEVMRVDYPERWPDLLPQLTGLVGQSMSALRGLFDHNTTTSQEIDGDVIQMMLLQLKGALGVLRGCCKIYEDPLKIDADAADAFASQLVPSLVSLVELLTSRWQRELDALASHGPAAATSGAALTAPLRFSPELEELSHCMRLTIKCVFSLFANRWPACLCEVSALDCLYTACVVTPVQALQKVVLPLCQARLEHALRHPAETGMTVVQLRGDHFADFQKSPLFMLLKWNINVAYKLTQEFGSPKSCERRCRAVAKHFAAQYLQPTVEAALQLVRWHAGPPLALASKAYILALEVLTLAVEHKATYTAVLHPAAEELMTVLLFPRLAFTAEDEELWYDNPEEYVRKQSNPAGDIYSAKVVSTSLLMSLAVGTKKFHDKDLFASLVNFLLNQLQAYVAVAAQATGEEADLYTPAMEGARRVDAALYCFYHFKKLLLAMRFGDDKLELVLSTFTVPVTQYPLGFLRARAVLVLSTFAPSLQWSSAAAYQRALQPVLGLLNDPEAPVRVQACVCFSRLVCHPFARDVINPCIAELIQHYFNVMRMMDNEAVVRTLRRTISFYKDTLSQWALELTEMLVNHFAVVLERVTSKYNALESMTAAPAAKLAASSGGSGDDADPFLDDDGFADVLMAADELLETLTTLVKALPESAATTAARQAAAAAVGQASGAPMSSSSAPAGASSSSAPEALQQDIFVHLQLRVAPMLFVILGHQGGSSFGFMDPALSLLTTLLSRSPAVAPPMWKVLWCLHQLIVRGGAVDYIQQLLPPIDNFASVEPSAFLYRSLADLAQEPLPSSVPPEEAAKTPAQLVFVMCDAVLASTCLRAREVAAVPKVFDALVQNSWVTASVLSLSSSSGAAPTNTDVVQHVAQQALTIAGTRPQLSPTFRVLLADNVFSCLIANAPATVGVLHGLQATRAFFEYYVTESIGIDGVERVLGLMRGYDVDLFVYAVVACLRALAANAVADAAAAAELQASLEGIVQCGVLQRVAQTAETTCVAELNVHERRIAKLSGKPAPSGAAAAGAGGDGEDDEEEEWDSDEDSDGDDDDGDDWLHGDDDDDDDNLGDGDWEGEEDDDMDDVCGTDGGAGRGLSGDSRLQGMLHHAQAMRQRKGHGPADAADNDAADDDDCADNLLDDEDFSSPLDNVNVWAALVAQVQRTDLAPGGPAAAVVELLRSEQGVSQANAIMSARDVAAELHKARLTHRALLDQAKNK